MQNAYIEKQAKKEYMRLVHADRGEYYYSCEEFGKMDLIIQIEIIRLILKNFRDSVKDITEQHYKMVVSLTKKEAENRCVCPEIYV